MDVEFGGGEGPEERWQWYFVGKPYFYSVVWKRKGSDGYSEQLKLD